MEIPIPKSIKKLWELWELRFSLVLSLFMQAFLILFSPLRKRTKNRLMLLLLWSAYLLADWIARFAVGIISNSQGQNNNCSNEKGDYDADILAFWASFLLVHLGGPDTISAFSQEDNELWLRHLAAFVFQSMAAIYVFFQSLPKNRLWMPTIFIFITGLIKYAERILSLYLASLNSVREGVFPNYAQLMEKYRSMKDANLPTRIEMICEPERRTKSVDRVREGRLTDTEVVLYAYGFFETFKGLIVDQIFYFRERNKSRDFFLQRDVKDAFRVIEVELNFIYESFFSKVSVLYSSLGYFCRFITFALVVASLGLFYCVDKINFKDSRDVAVTYILLIGAIALDVIAFIKLITSDWFTVYIKRLPEVDLKDPIMLPDGPGKTSKKPSCGYFGQLLHDLLLRRWSESVSSCNLISYCLNPRPPLKKKVINFFKLTDFLDGYKYVKQKRFTKDLREHIFDELKMKSEMADDIYSTKEISAAKGDWTLRAEHCTQFLPYVLEVDYDQSLLTWHIATELCFNDVADTHKLTDEEEKHKYFSKLLSDYMLYLLIRQPEMMSEVAPMGQVGFRDTCAEAKKFFASEYEHLKKKDFFNNYVCRAIITLIACLVAFLIQPFIYVISGCDLKRAHAKTERATKYFSDTIRHSFPKRDDHQEKQRRACRKMLSVNTEIKPAAIKGDKSKSVLFDGCILAKELINLEDKKKWLIMSKVWVEIMSYAAMNCRASMHAQQLSKGGELITIVWFFMVHFGFGDQFKINEGEWDHVRAKFVVGK